MTNQYAKKKKEIYFDLKEEREECLTEKRRVPDHRSDEVKRLQPLWCLVLN